MNPFNFLTDYERWFAVERLVHGYGLTWSYAIKCVKGSAPGLVGITVMPDDLLGDAGDGTQAWYVQLSDYTNVSADIVGCIPGGCPVYQNADGKWHAMTTQTVFLPVFPYSRRRSARIGSIEGGRYAGV